MSTPLKPRVAAFVHFLGLARPGVAAGLALPVVFLPVYMVLRMRTGLGPFVDVICGLLLGALALVLVTSVIMLGLVLLRHIPLRFGALVLTMCLCVIAAGKELGYSAGLSIHLAAAPLLLLVSTGAGVSILLRRGPGPAGPARLVLGSLLLLVAAVAAVALVWWLAVPGDDPFRESTQPVASGSVDPLNAPNPSQAGPYPIGTLCYGSGTDRRRPEHGPSVDLKTDPVDASPLISPSTRRLELWTRRNYWGFEPNHFPLNARVWFPQAEGLFPLVLIVHGNHGMEQPSEAGYAYLGELLASRGFIVASVDENFLNDGWSDDFSEGYGVRSWLLLKHLEWWRTWNEQEGNPFYHRVDLTNIALIGQSRGGEAIVHAATFNRLSHHPDNARIAFHFGFGIKTLIALAPTDGRYHPRSPVPPLEDINYLVLQGSHDGDLGGFAGARRYRRIAFTGREYRMKAALYIYRANHSQFNTVWGQQDEDPPLAYLLNRGPLLDPEEQRSIAKVYLSAFLEATLHARPEYVPLFRDHRRGASWLPNTVYFSRFQDCDFRTITDFDAAGDLTETTMAGGTQRGEHLETCERREMTTRPGQSLGDSAMVLGWNTACPGGGPPAPASCYTITLPDALPTHLLWGEGMTLSFCLADTGERCPHVPNDNAGRANSADCPRARPADGTARNQEGTPIDLTVELVASDDCTARLPLSDYLPLPRAIKVTFSKWAYWERVRYGSPVEPVLQTFEIPLADFVKANPDFDLAQLKQIRFVFDRTESAVILLDHVGITRVRYFPKTPS